MPIRATLTHAEQDVLSAKLRRRMGAPERDPGPVANLDVVARVAAGAGARPIPGTTAALALSDAETFWFRGVRYRVRALPYTAGAELQAIRLRLSQLLEREKAGPSDPWALTRTTVEIGEEAARYFHRWSRPERRAHRVLVAMFGRWIGNPFRTMTVTDLLTLLDFFWSCRTRSSVRLTGPNSSSAGG